MSNLNGSTNVEFHNFSDSGTNGTFAAGNDELYNILSGWVSFAGTVKTKSPEFYNLELRTKSYLEGISDVSVHNQSGRSSAIDSSELALSFEKGINIDDDVTKDSSYLTESGTAVSNRGGELSVSGDRSSRRRSRSSFSLKPKTDVTPVIQAKFPTVAYQKHWDKLSKFLQNQKLKRVKLPYDIIITEQDDLRCPGLIRDTKFDEFIDFPMLHDKNGGTATDENINMEGMRKARMSPIGKEKVVDFSSVSFLKLESEGSLSDDEVPRVGLIRVIKRFSSRKIPHLLEIYNVDKTYSCDFIFKEDDNIEIDVHVMRLIKMSNAIWSSVGIWSKLRTYKVVATEDRTGFVEVVSGSVMMTLHAEDIFRGLYGNVRKWLNFYRSLVALTVICTVFDITDRHHGNSIFTFDGDICLIDLSASLGHKAPLDVAFRINPIYLPLRIKNVNEYVKFDPVVSSEHFDELDFEQDALLSYDLLYENLELNRILKEEHGFTMPEPAKFRRFFAERMDNNQQGREGLRNEFVKAMNNSKFFTNFVSKITSNFN